MATREKDVSEIGYWSEVKLDIIRQYAAAYSTILTAQVTPALKHVYIDGFSGAGFHRRKGTGDLVWGSPMSVLLVTPPFREYHFIDLDRGNIETLQAQVRTKADGAYDARSVFFYSKDCNEVLLSEVFPRVRYEDYARALCLLDPCGLHLDWRVIEAAGRMRSVELFLNFPIMDTNRNVLRRNRAKVSRRSVARMTRYWGDDSWTSAAYSSEDDLFGFEEKTTNEALVRAFRGRLRSVAGFTNVPEPIAMRNSRGAAVYYLFFASPNPTAQKIVSQIFERHRDRSE